MYADDMSLYAIINNENDYKAFQNDLNNLFLWCTKWGLKINYDKCKVVHFCSKNFKFPYTSNNNLKTVTESEIIFGMTINDLLLFDKHIYTKVKKGYNFSNMILSNIKGSNIETYISLFKCYVRLILEYGAVIYMPYYMYLIDAIEKVQRNFIKKLPGLCNITYLQRLNVCKIESLEERNIKIDLTWMYKILHNLISINLGNNIKLSVNSEY